MTNRILISLSAVALATSVINLNKREEYNPDNIPTEIHAHFLNWRMKYKKLYNTPREYIYRVQIFYENYLKVKEMRKDVNILYLVELNKFADLSKEEFLSRWSGLRQNFDNNQEGIEIFEASQKEKEEIPKRIDWRDKNCITEIRSQSGCASSWSISVATSLECYYMQKKKEIYQLSAQEFIDCISEKSNYGCKGGDPEDALNYSKEKKVNLEYEYPYTANAEKCKRVKSRFDWGPITEFKKIKIFDEKSFEVAANIGVIMVSLDAFGLMFYKGGIINGSKTSSINHVVAVVGYNEERVYLNGKNELKKFWIVKNSWGKNWGENGYFRVERGSRDVANVGTLGIYLRGYVITK